MARWYYARDKKKLGPFSFRQLQQIAAAGKLKPSDMVFKEGFQKWVPASSIERLLPPTASGASPSMPSMPLLARSADVQLDRARWPWIVGAAVGIVLLGVGLAVSINRLGQSHPPQNSADTQLAASSQSASNPEPKPGPTPEPKPKQERKTEPKPEPNPEPKQEPKTGSLPEELKFSSKMGLFFSFPKYQRVSEEACRKAIAYLEAMHADKAASRLVDVICPEAMVRLAKDLQKASGNILIDGKGNDWVGVPAGTHIAKSKPTDAVPEGIDLADVSCLWTDKALFIRLRTHAKPETTNVRYDMQLLNQQGELTYQVIVSSDSIQLWHRLNKTAKFIPVEKQGESRIDDIIEARLDRALLPDLGETFYAQGVSCSEKPNRLIFSPVFKVNSLSTLASTTAAYLLARYADQIDLEKSDLVPLAACITEALIYENVEQPLRERVIEDGLAMIAASRKVPGRLANLPPEAVLAWTNREGMFSQSMTREGYEFRTLDPRILSEVRDHLLEAGLGKHKTVKELATAIDAWAENKNRYRWKVEDLEVWAKTSPHFKNILKETKEDVKAGRDKICTVDGQTIEFYAVCSFNFDWKFYRKNGFYYGSCGDVATMTALGYRAMGIPETGFVWRFGVEDPQTHTFAGYFDSADGKWKSLQAPSLEWAIKKYKVSALLWSFPPLTDTISSSVRAPLPEGVDDWVSNRRHCLPLSAKEMREKLLLGFSHDEYCRLLYSQLGGHDMGASDRKNRE